MSSHARNEYQVHHVLILHKNAHLHVTPYQRQRPLVKIYIYKGCQNMLVPKKSVVSLQVLEYRPKEEEGYPFDKRH
jgi:hypothetical protein